MSADFLMLISAYQWIVLSLSIWIIQLQSSTESGACVIMLPRPSHNLNPPTGKYKMRRVNCCAELVSKLEGLDAPYCWIGPGRRLTRSTIVNK